MIKSRDGADAAECRAIIRRHARTFALASRLLPQEKRRGAFALYATCRTADDIVDLGDPSIAATRLRRFRDEVEASLRQSAARPALRELAWAVHRFQVPTDALRRLFGGLERDLTHTTFASWNELEEYCRAVAGTVGEMVCSVFGVRADWDEPLVVRHAQTLGVAMQLTNVLRDVGEDAARGRCYLPVDELARYGLSAQQVLQLDVRGRWADWRSFMAFQVDRARGLYRQAVDGIAGLEPDAVPCALSCAAGYAGILQAIERRGYDTLSGRASTDRLHHLRVAWYAWRHRTPSFGPRVASNGESADCQHVER